MTECGVCPQAVCITTGVVNTPTAAPSSSSSSNDTGAIIGGVVGGLVGLGIIVGIAVYCYLSKQKKVNGKLPFAFTSANHMPRVVQQEKAPAPTPHPAVIAALAHQNDRLSQTYNNTTTNNNNNNRQSVHSLDELNSTSVPEEDEFEKRIALQNKRISEILLGNPRLSYSGLQPPQLQPKPRSSYYTTDEESDMDDRKSVSTVDSGAVVRTATPQSSVAVVQVVRAKPQIMRVNSVRSTTTGGGLSRNDSVRTVLTAITPSESSLTIPGQKLKEEDEDLFEFPTTPNNLSFVEDDDPFHDTHSIPNTNEFYTIDDKKM